MDCSSLNHRDCHWEFEPAADPPGMKPAFTVMAGLVPAICDGRVPRWDRPGTGPAMTMKAGGFRAKRRGNPGHAVCAQLDPRLPRMPWSLALVWPWGRFAPSRKPGRCDLSSSPQAGNHSESTDQQRRGSRSRGCNPIPCRRPRVSEMGTLSASFAYCGNHKTGQRPQVTPRPASDFGPEGGNARAAPVAESTMALPRGEACLLEWDRSAPASRPPRAEPGSRPRDESPAAPRRRWTDR